MAIPLLRMSVIIIYDYQWKSGGWRKRLLQRCSNRIEDSYCNEDVIRECINEAENKGYQLSVKDVTMYNDNPSKLVVLSYNVTFPILNMFNRDNKKQAVIEGYAR